MFCTRLCTKRGRLDYEMTHCRFICLISLGNQEQYQVMFVLGKRDHLASVLVRAVVILVLAVLPKLCLFAQENSDGNAYLIDVWQTQDGLPANLVNSILETRDGYLWIATFGGLARFDGDQFVKFNSENSRAFRHSRIWGLHESREGDLWIGSDGGGMTRYHEGQFINYGLQQGLSSDSVDCIGEDATGGIWITNLFAGGLNRWEDGKITAHSGRDLPANLKSPWGFQTNDSGQILDRPGKHPGVPFASETEPVRRFFDRPEGSNGTLMGLRVSFYSTGTDRWPTGASGSR